MLLGRLPHPR